MKTVLIPSFVDFSFGGGVAEINRMMAAQATACGVRLTDITGKEIQPNFKLNAPSFRLKWLRRAMHIRTMLQFEKRFPAADMVLFQTSLNAGAYRRDRRYIKGCITGAREFSVFIHGWNEEFAAQLVSKKKSLAFAHDLAHARSVIVLAESFRDTLVEWGVPKKLIIVETTMVDDELLRGFVLQEKLRKRAHSAGLRVLFLGRVVKEKGVYESLEAFALHSKKYSQSTLTIAGTGPELDRIRAQVDRRGIDGVVFPGFVEGLEKARLLGDADVFIFPSYYGEGMPVAVLEAMGFGNAIITRPVGGLVTFFKTPDMGYAVTSSLPEDYANVLDSFCRDKWALDKVAEYNHRFAAQHLLASVVAKRIFRLITAA